jgi:hypothetical protein
VVSAHFYHNLVFVYKGENSEESNFVVNNVVPPNFRRSRRREAKELLKRSLRAALSVATQRSPSR